MQAAIGYIRVSTIGQAEEGVSLEAQEAAIRAYCVLRGLELTDVVVDSGVSGGKELATRDGGQRVLDAARKRTVQAVVAYKLDRLFRDAADCLNVTKHWDKVGTSLHLIDVGGQSIDTSSTMGRFFLTMMAGVAEMERNMIGDRTKSAMAHKRSKNERISRRIPFGWDLEADGVKLTENPIERAVIREMQSLRESGLSFRKIADELNRQGIKAKQGGQWIHTSIKTILAKAAV